jgi:hypothetical protein
MQELLRYLRANGFKTFIVSGGGADFMRVWSAMCDRRSPPKGNGGNEAVCRRASNSQ